MNDTVKKHKRKILSGGIGAVGIGTILFFWQMGVGPADLKALPGINNRVMQMEERIQGMKATDAALMSEIAESRKAREQLTKEVATLTAQLEIAIEMQKEMRQDIKELLRR